MWRVKWDAAAIGMAIFVLCSPVFAVSPLVFDRAILSRSDSDCPTNFKYCKSNLPSNFCCPSSRSCVVVADNTTLICCPSGSTCQEIEPVTCQLRQQNATLYPESNVKSTNLTGSLEECGTDTCCPSGYSCQNSECVIESNASSLASSSTLASGSATAAATVASTSPANVVATATSALDSSDSGSSTTPASSQSSQSSDSSHSGFSTSSFIIGLVPGIVAGAVIALVIIFLLGRWRSKKEHSTNAKKYPFGRVSATISDPIYQPEYVTRTDFLRHESGRNCMEMGSRTRNVGAAPPAPKGMGNRFSETSMKMRSFFSPTYTDVPQNPMPVVPAAERHSFATKASSSTAPSQSQRGLDTPGSRPFYNLPSSSSLSTASRKYRGSKADNGSDKAAHGAERGGVAAGATAGAATAATVEHAGSSKRSGDL